MKRLAGRTLRRALAASAAGLAIVVATLLFRRGWTFGLGAAECALVVVVGVAVLLGRAFED